MTGIKEQFDFSEPASSCQRDDPPEENGDVHPFNKTYIALEGLTEDEIDDEDIESIERKLRHFTVMKLNLPVENVRVVSSDKNVVEIFKSDEEKRN